MKQIELSIKYLKTTDSCRVQLFNKKCYMIKNRQARLQIPLFSEGKVTYHSIAKEIPIEMIFHEIKCVFKNKELIAIRVTHDEPLAVTKKFVSKICNLQKKLELAKINYENLLRKEFGSWLYEIKKYCYEKNY